MSFHVASRQLTCGYAMLAMLLSGPATAEQVKAEISEGGRSFMLESPGLGGCTGRYSARVVIGDREHELSSVAGDVVRLAVRGPTEATPQGTAVITESTIRFPHHQVDLLFRLGRVEGTPGVLLQAGICNRGSGPVRLVSVIPVAMEFAVASDPATWLVTTFDNENFSVPAPTSLAEINEPLTVREYGGFYRNDGVGFVFGPVGAPVAFVDASISRAGGGRFSFVYRSDMSRVRVDPGETRWGQQVALLMEPPRQALARWAEWVGVTHGARTQAGALSGWNSWSFLGGRVSGADVLAVVGEALKSSERLRPAVIQIDAGYEDPSGARESNERFPEGMAFYAEKITATGARPGLLLECNLPTRRYMEWKEVADRAGEMVGKGYSYIKLNTRGMVWVAVGNDRQTAFEVMREGFAAVRKAVGETTYLLNNGGSPNRAAIGQVDAQRTSLDASRKDLRPALKRVSRCHHLQGRWGAVDNDAFYLGTDVANVSAIDGGWPTVRTWASMVGMSCGAAMTSDPWYLESFQPLLRNVEIMTPPAQEHSEVLDLCTGRDFPRLIGHVAREWGNMTVALLWNPGTSERTVSLNFAEAGMAADHRHAVWSFWDNRFLGVAKGSWTTPSLGPSASQHLCFTDLDRTPNRPVLIGSNLHIYCGAAEIRRVSSLVGAMEIELTDAGARDGDLFVYSQRKPVLNSASGCTVEQITYAGENVWRIALTGRQRGAAQRLELGIQLPVTQQPWFWLLAAGAGASLMIAAWRYVVSLRLQREHAIHRERGRIAQDLHDNIGANLAQIGLLTGQAEAVKGDPDELQAQLERIFGVSQATAKELKAVVWSVDSSHDTLEELARFIHGYAEDFLETAGVRCHFLSTEALPSMRVSSTVRHHLLSVAKEAIHNAAQHADATVVTIRIGLEGNRIVLEIADDGCGLPPANALKPGNGLANMRSRAAELGGACEFLAPATGQGTIVRITVPTKPSITPAVRSSDVRP